MVMFCDETESEEFGECPKTTCLCSAEITVAHIILHLSSRSCIFRIRMLFLLFLLQQRGTVMQKGVQ